MEDSDKTIIDHKKNFPNRDAYLRENFLIQAAGINLSHNEELSRYYMKCFCQVKEKKTLRWSREMKQSICRGCNMLLIPGVTSRVRIRAHCRLVITCLTCSSIKRANIEKPNPSKSKKRRRRKHKMYKISKTSSLDLKTSKKRIECKSDS